MGVLRLQDPNPCKADVTFMAGLWCDRMAPKGVDSQFQPSFSSTTSCFQPGFFWLIGFLPTSFCCFAGFLERTPGKKELGSYPSSSKRSTWNAAARSVSS